MFAVVWLVLLGRLGHAGVLSIDTNRAYEELPNKMKFIIIPKDELVSFTANETHGTGTVDGWSWTFTNGTPGISNLKGPVGVTFGAAAEGFANGCTVQATHTGEGGVYCSTPSMAVTVIVPKFLTPAGNPVTAPVDQGTTGANEFTFSSATAGELTINLSASVPGGVLPHVVNNFRFSVEAVGDSTLEWANGNEDGKPTALGSTVTATVKFKGLPTSNSAFGKKKATLTYSGRAVAEAEYEVFFPRDQTNHPGGQAGSPNWYHYWSMLISGHALSYGGAGTGAGAEVQGMTSWSYATAPNKTQITVYDPSKGKYKSYGVGEEFSGIDRYIGTVKHEAKHVDQIARADALLSSNGSDSFQHGWSFNQLLHNHWTKGPDAKWGVAGTDDDSDTVLDNAKSTPPFEPGRGDDENLNHATYSEWPKSWALPNPNNAPHPIESEAINESDNNHSEHDNARDDWGNPGKNHKTIDKYDD
jgi:hypothetical protein